MGCPIKSFPGENCATGGGLGPALPASAKVWLIFGCVSNDSQCPLGMGLLEKLWHLPCMGEDEDDEDDEGEGEWGGGVPLSGGD